MKTAIIFSLAFCASSLATAAETNAAPASAETAAIMSAVEDATGWTAAELSAGLDRLDRLYANDMKTEAGRRRWHGNQREKFLDATTGETVTIYEDGEEFRVAANLPVKKPAAAKTVSTNGIPAALAAARKKAVAESVVVSNVTVNISASAK